MRQLLVWSHDKTGNYIIGDNSPCDICRLGHQSPVAARKGKVPGREMKCNTYEQLLNFSWQEVKGLKMLIWNVS